MLFIQWITTSSRYEYPYYCNEDRRKRRESDDVRIYQESQHREAGCGGGSEACSEIRVFNPRLGSAPSGPVVGRV